MSTITRGMTAAVSMALSMVIFAATVLTFMLPFVLAAQPITEVEYSLIGALWLMGLTGLVTIFLAVRR